MSSLKLFFSTPIWVSTVTNYKKTNEDNDELESFKISRIDLQLKRKLGSSQRVLMMNELINLEQARRDIDDRYN